jgi:hypothetical protein
MRVPRVVQELRRLSAYPLGTSYVPVSPWYCNHIEYACASCGTRIAAIVCIPTGYKLYVSPWYCNHIEYARASCGTRIAAIVCIPTGYKLCTGKSLLPPSHRICVCLVWYKNCGDCLHTHWVQAICKSLVLQSHRICACLVWSKNYGAQSSPLQESRKADYAFPVHVWWEEHRQAGCGTRIAELSWWILPGLPPGYPGTQKIGGKEVKGLPERGSDPFPPRFHVI